MTVAEQFVTRLGIRVDTGKHMWPSHMEAIYTGLLLPDGREPFIVNEV